MGKIDIPLKGSSFEESKLLRPKSIGLSQSPLGKRLEGAGPNTQHLGWTERLSSTFLPYISKEINLGHEILPQGDISNAFASCHVSISIVLKNYLEKQSLPPLESLSFIYSFFFCVGLGLPGSYLGPTPSPLDLISPICLLAS